MSSDRPFRRLEEPQKRGQASEAILKAAFVVRDVPLLTPEYDNEPYDFVIEVGDEFRKIQAKTAYRSTDSTVRFETLRTKARAEGYQRDSYEGEIDYFAVYNPVLDERYLIHIEAAPKGKMELRHERPSNNQKEGINWHTDYLLDTVLTEITD